MTIWNFAYGANMARATLARREVTPISSCAARVDGYVLRFETPGIPFLEPAFATIVTADQHAVHGVLHQFSAADQQRLDHFEGRGVAYKLIDVPVERYDGSIVTAKTYVSRFRITGRRPSRRYLRLLLAGASEHDLSEDYQQWLGAHDSSPFHMPARLMRWTASVHFRVSSILDKLTKTRH